MWRVKAYRVEAVSAERKDSVVSIEAEASELLRELVGDASYGGGRVKAALRDATEITGFEFNRVRKIWYRQARAILAVEMDELRAKAKAARAGKNDAARSTYEAVAERLDEQALELADLRRELAEAKGRMAGARADQAG